MSATSTRMWEPGEPSVMFAQMQLAAVADDACVERRIVVEAVFEAHLETEEAEVELMRLGDVEDAQDRGDGAELRHGVATVGRAEANYFSSSSRSR
jgi:hypothetical protein